ncbi:MAG: hypothetical protein ACLP9L_33210 [Thermoguttaceae bacterium]
MPQPCPPIHVAPAEQPTSVPEIAEILFPAYTVDDGRVSFAGCALEDRLVLQLAYEHGNQRLEVYLNSEGKEVDGQPIAQDRQMKFVTLSSPPNQLDVDWERLLAAGTRIAEERLPVGVSRDLVSCRAIWCKYVEGKLRFTITAASMDLPFSGWTRTLSPPPFVCPHTGAATFRLAATDDGRIAAAERIEPCAETGRRMLSTELVRCAVTGHRVSPELAEVCPISGRRLLRTEMVECDSCHQRVSPQVVERNQCVACRRLKAVKKADPRMARLLHEHPALDRWRRWRMGETSRVYVLVATGWLKRLLVVIDKETLELRHLATGSRLSPRWAEVEPAQFLYVLRE